MHNTPQILVTTDFSDIGDNAFKAAEALAEYLHGEITPFYAFIMPEEIHEPRVTHAFNITIDYSALEADLQNQLREKAESLIDKKYLKPVKTAKGYPATAILDAAVGFDIIVMSSHGRRGFSRLFMGSVAEKVLRLSKKPVLIVESKSLIKPLRKILVTTDFSDPSKAAFPWAKKLASAADAEIDVVNVVSFEQTSAVGFYNPSYETTLIDDVKEKLHSLIDEHFSDIRSRVKGKVIYSHLSAHQRLAELIKENEYDLIVMATVGHSGVDYLVLGSTTASLVRRVETAVLVVHPD